jgi:ubiquinone/menaquinone biosynthesis C-methylase UbiE
MALWHPQQKVLAMDVSLEGVVRAREAAVAHGVAGRMAFVVGDAERLPFKEGSLPAVVSSQVLEHLSDFDLGVKEMHRVLHPEGVGVIGIPACVNPSAMVLLGGDDYWCISRRTPFAFWKGLLRSVQACLKGEEGVQEGYAGHMELPHIRRFPWRAINRVEQNGLRVTHWMADSILLPYLGHFFPSLIRLQQVVDENLRTRRFYRNFGVGLVMVVQREL